MKNYIKIHPNDVVAVALSPLAAGTVISIDGITVTLQEDIPQGHKFALVAIHEGDPIIKYGYPIGYAKTDIPQGSWIHVHNIKTGLGDLLNYTYDRKVTPISPTEERFFDGYRRPNGKVGVRNEIWIIPTVGCVNNIATTIERQAQKFKTGTIDDIAAFPHPYGCSQMGDDQEHTRSILADLINHPNAGGVLVLGLGCENSNIDVLKEYIGEYNPNRVKFLVCQESDDEVTDALKLIEELAAYAGSFHREPIKNYFKSHNQTIYENPSPGNKKGGISTLEDKSMGCTQKSGSAPVMGVLSYGEPVSTKGLNLLSAPGNDLVASTALAASGAHIVLFTTGRGTPFASPVPTVKISSNSNIAKKKQNWIDFNCGVLTEDVTLDELSDQLFDFVIAIASGKKVKAEEAGFHDMAIFKQGVTL